METRIKSSRIRGLARQFAPLLVDIIPDSYLPDSTGDVDLYGEFFVPDMDVIFEGQTVNYMTFINSQHVRVNVTRGSVEGTFEVILNNGIESVWTDAILVVLGDVTVPSLENYSTLNFLTAPNPGELSITNINDNGIAVIDSNFITIPPDIDYEIRFKWKIASILNGTFHTSKDNHFIELLSLNDDSLKYKLYCSYIHSKSSDEYINTYCTMSSVSPNGTNTPLGGGYPSFDQMYQGLSFKIQRVDNVTRMFSYNGQVTMDSEFNDNMYIKLQLNCLDVVGIKYIELAE